MDELLIALDVDTADEARRLAQALRGLAGGFKVGSQLFTREGPSIVRELVDRGDRIFLDLKFHDIPNTVAAAIEAATLLGVWMVDVHTSAGAAMMGAAKQRTLDAAARRGLKAPLVVGITVLTSFDESSLQEVGVHRAVCDHVEALAALAKTAGLDGVVASPHEIALVRECCGPEFTIVTPGIRDLQTEDGARNVPHAAGRNDDQRRTMSARDAIAAGANYIVVGRPIVAAPDPRGAAEQLIERVTARA